MSTTKKVSGPYTTAEEFYGKLREEYADVRRHPNSARHLANFVMTAYHLAEWTWQLARKRLPGASAAVREEYFKQHLPETRLLAGLANGTKHCVLDKQARRVGTATRAGAFSAGFSAGFDIGSLQVDDGGKMVDFGEIAARVMAYWDGVFGPTQDGPGPAT